MAREGVSLQGQQGMLLDWLPDPAGNPLPGSYSASCDKMPRPCKVERVMMKYTQAVAPHSAQDIVFSFSQVRDEDVTKGWNGLPAR